MFMYSIFDDETETSMTSGCAAFPPSRSFDGFADRMQHFFCIQVLLGIGIFFVFAASSRSAEHTDNTWFPSGSLADVLWQHVDHMLPVAMLASVSSSACAYLSKPDLLLW